MLPLFCRKAAWAPTGALELPEVKALPADVTGIIVLGGALETDLSAARGMPSLNDAAERMTSLVYLARHYPKARLAFTGGNGELIHAPMPEATGRFFSRVMA